MVSTHLARLEARLGTRLIHRTTRRFALTPQGNVLLEEARLILDAMGHAENLVRRSEAGPSGRVAVDAPGAIGLRFVVPALLGLRAAHPRIMLDLSVGDRSMLFRPEAFDLLIRVGVPSEGKGEIIRLGQTRFLQVAAPAYLERRGFPATPDALHDHDCILYATAERPVGQWRFRRGKEQRSVRPDSVATFNHGDAITAAAVAGLGVAQTLELLVAPELASGKLVQVLGEWNHERVDVQLFIPQDRSKRPAVRTVAEYLQTKVDWNSVS
jgi:DNA-binding transcriptional LysR family regulator